MSSQYSDFEIFSTILSLGRNSSNLSVSLTNFLLMNASPVSPSIARMFRFLHSSSIIFGTEILLLKKFAWSLNSDRDPSLSTLSSPNKRYILLLCNLGNREEIIGVRKSRIRPILLELIFNRLASANRINRSGRSQSRENNAGSRF